MITINLREEVRLVTGEALSAGNGEPVSLASVLITSLGVTAPSQIIGPKEKFQRGALAARIKDAFLEPGTIELSDKEVELLKLAVGYACQPFVVHAVWKLLGHKEE